MRYVDVRLLQLLRSHIDGVPLISRAGCCPRARACVPGILTHSPAGGGGTASIRPGPSTSGGGTPLMSTTASAGLLDSLIER